MDHLTNWVVLPGMCRAGTSNRNVRQKLSGCTADVRNVREGGKYNSSGVTFVLDAKSIDGALSVCP